MDRHGLLVRFEAKPGKDDEVIQLLRSSLPLVTRERETTAWFAVRFGRSEYGIFDAFPDEEARDAHLSGAVARGLMERTDLFAAPPQIHKVDVLAEKLQARRNGGDAKALLLTFKPKAGREHEVERFLRNAEPLVAAEPKTTAWFALRLDNGEYGIFDAFPDNGARFAHLTGRVPRELAKNAVSLFGSFPDMDMLSVIAEKLPDLSTKEASW